MTAAGLLANLRARGVALRADDGALVVDGPGDVLTPEVLAELRACKPEVLALLTSPGPRCPVCQSLAHRVPGPDCDLRPILSCRDFPPPGPVAPLGAPAGVEYEPGQDWQPDELQAHADESAWLFDASRDYLEQLAVYKARRGATL